MLKTGKLTAQKFFRPKSASIYRSLPAWIQKGVPVIIPCRDNYTYVRLMISQLRKFDIESIILIDNGSTYPELVKLLRKPPEKVSVLLLDDNKGPRFPVTDEMFYNSLPNYFCLTDPDIEFSKFLPTDFIGRLATISENHKMGKVGLALSLEEKHKMIQDKIMYDEPKHIWEHEAQFWQLQIGCTPEGHPIYDAAIDTTFALYNKRYFNPSHFFKSLRVAGHFTSRHLPWYINNGMPKAEDEYYRSTSTHSYYLRSNPKSKTAYQNEIQA